MSAADDNDTAAAAAGIGEVVQAQGAKRTRDDEPEHALPAPKRKQGQGKPPKPPADPNVVNDKAAKALATKILGKVAPVTAENSLLSKDPQTVGVYKHTHQTHIVKSKFRCPNRSAMQHVCETKRFNTLTNLDINFNWLDNTYARSTACSVSSFIHIYIYILDDRLGAKAPNLSRSP